MFNNVPIDMEIQTKLKERLALGINYGLKSLEEVVSPSSSLWDEVVAFKSRYNELNRIVSHSLIPYEQLEIGLNKIRLGLIDVINKLSEADLKEREELPDLKNNELQFRKNSFFQLLDIHFKNLSTVAITYHGGVDYKEEVKYGRAAISEIYDNFKYAFTDTKGGEIIAFTSQYLARQRPRLEVYMKTVEFILRYIMEEELEQSFFLNVLLSILSTHELLLIFYYALSDIDDDFSTILVEAKIFDDKLKKRLIQEAHYDLMADKKR